MNLFDNPTSEYENGDEIGIFIYNSEGYRTILMNSTIKKSKQSNKRGIQNRLATRLHGEKASIKTNENST
jgi:hypothetical protein